MQRLHFLNDVLQRRATRLSCTTGRYLTKLEVEPQDGELAALGEELTVAETYFFRHNDQFRALAEVALPDRMRMRAAARSLRLFSAGCATGEEPYSLAIVAHETVADPAWNILIRAVDLNPVVLQRAAEARYSAWALRETPPDVKNKWFRGSGREVVLDDKARATVQFEQGNLASDDPTLWPPSFYDVIFCRNVLMYFAPEQMRAAIGRMAASLAPGGYLFLGHAETLRGISDDFALCHTHDAFYYQRKDQLCPVETIRPRFGGAARPAPIATLLPPPATTQWFDIIQQASGRVAALMPAHGKMPAPKQPAAWRLAPALELLRHDRFDEALEHVRSGPPENKDNPDVLLVTAVLLAQSGQPAAAEEVCQQLLLIDGLNAGAHYVLALCREQIADCERAMEHDRLAAHLDPAFAMPRLHLGLLTRQTNDRDSARRELTQALLLLKREDVSRLLLFGGGFSRDALIALCQSAIADCGGRA